MNSISSQPPGAAPLVVLHAPAFLRLGAVIRITALSRPTLYRRIAAQRFPRPIHLGGRACGWATADLAAWIRDPEGYRASGDPAVRPQCRAGHPLKYPEFRGR